MNPTKEQQLKDNTHRIIQNTASLNFFLAKI
jgi:hypothetical protein